MAQGLLGRINAFIEDFSYCFKLINSKAQQVSSSYLQGLYVSSKRNCERISERTNHNSQSLTHFLSNSPWDWRAVGSHIAHLFVRMLPGSWLEDLSLSIDESGIPKKGKSSTGVGHQYCGQLGKNANCQVGVYTGLICRGFYCIIGALLYLPKFWCEDRQSDIPAERKTHKTKIQMAYEMILYAKQELKIPFKWVNFDSFYGQDLDFLHKLHDQQITFVGDIAKDTTVYLKKPVLYVPDNNPSKPGRKYTRYRIKGKSTEVQKINAALGRKDFKKVTVRTTKKGKSVKASLYIRTVYLAIKEHQSVMEVKLLIGRDEDQTIRYALCNDLKAHESRLAFMQSQRYFIERSFQELKQQLGLNQYQVRGYDAWHRHMHMCMMALLFMQNEKIRFLNIDYTPSTPQLAELIKILLPQKIKTLTLLLSEFEQIKIPKTKYCAYDRKSVT